MTVSIAHLGPTGTNAETAALLYANWLQDLGRQSYLCPYPSIVQSMQAVAQGQADVAIVPVENSIEGGVTVTLDTLWQLDALNIQQALILPIVHALMSHAETIDAIETIYSHPQALAQCQQWIEKFLPSAQVIPTSSTTEALQYLTDDITVGAIAAERASQIYNVPIMASPINDHPDNCTRFWALSLQPAPGGSHSSLVFGVRDTPGALLKPLQVFADHAINLSRIESRPTKRSLGDYLFFVDLEADVRESSVQTALTDVRNCTETLKVFGSYPVISMQVDRE